jgi:hypothetical protein
LKCRDCEHGWWGNTDYESDGQYVIEFCCFDGGRFWWFDADAQVCSNFEPKGADIA